MLRYSRMAGVYGALALPLSALLLMAPLDGLAATRTPAPPKAAKAGKAPAPKPAPTDAAFEQWLKKYGAYDRIVLPEPDQPGHDADANVLKRAEGLLMQGSPQEALKLIETQPAFEDAPSETQRLWLGAQAHRALGDPYKAVIWYSHATKLMDAKTLKDRLNAEPGLEALWVDVWRRQFWTFAGAASASSEALENNLRTLHEQAIAAWGPQNFWVKSQEALALITGEAQPEAAPEAKAAAKQGKTAKASAKDKETLLSVSTSDRQHIADLCLRDRHRRCQHTQFQ